MMLERSDAFVALPGGSAEVWSGHDLGTLDCVKPVMIVNIDGWDPLIAQFDHDAGRLPA